MAKQKIEIEVDIPDGYEATGEFRVGRKGEWFIDDGGFVLLLNEGESFGPRIILRRTELTEVQGPIDWPALKWAAKTQSGNWFLSVTEPHLVKCGFDAYATWLYANSVNWNPPPEIADLPPEKSLVKLRHTCRWDYCRPSQYRTECNSGSAYFMKKYAYCPDCGREVEFEESQNDD